MNNGHGSYRSTREAAMRAYDACHPRLRAVLRDAAFNWAAEPLARAVRRGEFRSPAEVKAMMRHETEQDTWRTYGPTHPEANNHGRRLRRSKNAVW